MRSSLPKSRAEARNIGSVVYFTGKPCTNGHTDERHTSSGGCKACGQERKAKRRAEKPEAVKATRDAWRLANLERERERERLRSAKRMADDPEKFRAYRRAWAARHIEEERVRGREKYKARMATNPEAIRAAGKRRDDKLRSTPKGRLDNVVSAGVHRGLTKGSKAGRRTFEILGYSIDDLVSHLERLFLPGMTWENYGKGGWHIDHKVPLSVHNYNTPDDLDFKRAWALSNLQPLWQFDNISKNARLAAPFQPTLAFGIPANDNDAAEAA